MSAITSKHSEERLYQVLLAPVISEKATFIGERNRQIMFRVVPNATKPEVKAAVELLFKVAVESVQISIAKGKIKRSGRIKGRRSDVKRAFVRLAEGQEIDFNAEAK